MIAFVSFRKFFLISFHFIFSSTTLVYYFQSKKYISSHHLLQYHPFFERSFIPAATTLKIHIDVPITLKCIIAKFPTIFSLKIKISSKINSQITPLKTANIVDKHTWKGSKSSSLKQVSETASKYM